MPMAGPPTAPSLAQTNMAPCKQPSSIKNASKPRLPTEIILIILANLDAQTLLSATSTCRQWYALAKRYRQYLWRHLAWHDFSFTAARGLWKLEFFNDRDLGTCFPRRTPSSSSEQRRGRSHRRTRSSSQSLTKNTDDHSIRGLAQGCHSSIASIAISAPCRGLGVDLGHGLSFNGSEAIERSGPYTGAPIIRVQKESNFVESTENRKKRQISNKGKESSGTRKTRFRSDDLGGSAHGIDRNASRCESDFDVHPDQAKAGLNPSEGKIKDVVNDVNDDLDLLGPREQDWKALYQLTSNWYRGRAKGYCPIMLPSLTTLASATQSIAQGSLATSSTLPASSTSSSSSSRECSTSSATTTAVAKTVSASTSAQAAIRRILRRRKPQTVVGLQHEGSALTALSLVAHTLPVSTVDTDEVHKNIESGSKRGQNQEFRNGVALARSNPHYRERRPPAQTQDHHQHHHIHNNHHHSNHAQQQYSQHSPTPNTTQPIQKPNIMVQDPLQHDNIQFAISVPSPPPQPLPTDVGANVYPNGSSQSPTEAQPTLTPPALSPIQASPPLGQTSDDPANDILCHFSSVLHSFIVTGHMDGSVRLWDLSIKEAGQQCIRLWHTGSRQRVLCVGMNSKVVVCGNVDSTLCVWDIHPAPGTSSSTHGTIHTASYLASTMPPGIEDWVSGIEHISVGDSLVACSTEFSGSVLVFSLATGSLVYEIPGLYQPSKMCMTDFFLLTGGRGAWNRGGRAQAQAIAQGHGHHGHGQGADRLRNAQNGQNLEVDEYMSCCVNVWDLRTGVRLYSLIPRLPMHHIQHLTSISSMIHGHRDESILKGKRTEKKRAIRTSSYSPDICSGSRSSAPPSNGTSASSTWATRMGMLDSASIAVPSPIAGSGDGNYARSRTTNNSPSLGLNAHIRMTSLSDSSTSSSSSLSSLSGISSTSTPSEGTSQTRRAILSPPRSPQSPISAPLTLLDIAVTPDHSTLVVTLCERSGEGREGVYAWDFSGTRLEGYHEQGQESGSTIIVDKSNLRLGSDDESDGGDYWDEGDERDLDILYESRARAREGSSVAHCDNGRDRDDFGEEDEELEDEEDFWDIDSRINNNMIMQQVDSTAFSALHQARVTGKVWIGWKLGDRDFQILRHRYVHRLEVQKRERQLRRERWMKGREQGSATMEPELELLSIRG